MRNYIFILFIIITINFSVSANSYYISSTATGSGNGSQSNPFTITQANNIAAAGDIFYIMPGNYDFTSNFNFSRGGTVSKPVVYTAFDMNDKPNFYANHNLTVDAFVIGGNCIEINGINFYGQPLATRSVIQVNGNYVTLKNGSSTYRAGGSSTDNDNIRADNIKHFLLQNWKVVASAWNAINFQITQSGGLRNLTFDNVEITGLTHHNAFNIFPNTTSSNPFHIDSVTIKNCWIHDNYSGASALLSRYMRMFSIYNNIIEGDLAFASGGTTPADTFDVSYPDRKSIIANNTFIGTGDKQAINNWVANGIIVKNNIFYGTFASKVYLRYTLNYQTNWTQGVIPGPPILNQDINNNLYFETSADGGSWIWNGATLTSFLSWKSSSGQDINSIIGLDPKFLDENINDYRLQAGSPAIDVGVDLSTYIGNEDRAGNSRVGKWDIGAYEYNSGMVNTDNTPPTLLSATVITPTSIALTFSEPLDINSAQTNSNYSINNGIIVNSAIISADGKTVTLSTTQNSANQTYTVTVTNVKDLAGNIISSNNNSAQYSYIGDSTPPNVLSASVINPTTIQLTFSESLEPNSALNKLNYSINNGIIINSISLSTDAMEVTLITSQNAPNQNYTITINNVKDLQGNLIASDTKINYGYQSLPSSKQLTVTRVYASSIPELNHTPDKTIDGKGANDGDPDSRWAGRPMPQWIVYDLGSVQTLMTTRLSFYNWNGGRIYNYSIQVSIDSLNWSEVKSNVQSSSLEWSIEEIGAVKAKYIKILFLSSNQPDWAGLWEANFWGEPISNYDATPPVLVNATVINPTTIQLTFSEALENLSASNKLNYSINNGVIINNVSLSSDATKVTLSTTQNIANQTYTVTVTNVKDLAGNIIQVGSNTVQYSYIGDSTPPALLSASATNATTVELLFSEALNLASAQATSNYSINNGIIVNSVTISSDQKKVTLSTSKHVNNTNYTIVVNNVRDLAGNLIGSVNSAQYVFIDNTTGDLKANVKVFLQGPFSGNSMLTELSANDFLSNTQPYNTAPWFYNGNEVLGSGASVATDWILVELHSSQDPKQVIARRACLLRNDGRIMEPNGTVGVTFNNLFYGSYYIVVRHRNHLAVMSASPVSFSPNNDLYDFTISGNQAYGQNAMIQITSGVFAMYAGDGNGDGIIDNKDRDVIWNDQNGNMGYLNGDFNLDSGVTVKDINDFWNLNQNQNTQVP